MATTSAPFDCAQLKGDLSEGPFDAVVIGSGAGGAVAAKELAEGGMKVALLEEGGYHRSHRDTAVDALSRLYRDAGTTSTLGSPIVPVPIGRCFGGTTVINSGTCFRTPDAVIRKWRERFGLTELGLEELERAFTRVEREIHVEPADFAVMSRSNTLVHELLKAQGFHGAPLRRNIKGCEGCGMCCYGCSSGAKQSMDVSYLPRALAAGVRALTHARVTRIEMRGDRAIAVHALAVDRTGRKTGNRVRLQAGRVIVSAGTFHTPSLLQGSGIARWNRHLGRHLKLHPATKLFAEFEEKLDAWEGTPQAYYLDTFQDEGLMYEGIFMPPDLAGVSMPFVGRELIYFMKRYAHMTSFGFLINDEAEGRLVNIPFLGPSYIYSLTPADVRRFQKGIAFLARVFLRGGAIKVFPLIHGWNFDSLNDVDRFEKAKLSPRHIDCMAFHPLGTCRVGRDEDNGVCDQDHRVFGTANVHVADGSSVPSSLGVNPQVTIMALATRMAGRMLGRTLQ